MPFSTTSADRWVLRQFSLTFTSFFFFLNLNLVGFSSQTDTVQALRGDPDSSEAEHVRIMLVQTEVERVKFVVRSYIRTRLYKVSIFPP